MINKNKNSSKLLFFFKINFDSNFFFTQLFSNQNIGVDSKNVLFFIETIHNISNMKWHLLFHII